MGSILQPHGKVDPAVLAALPPSMQLDLLVQMREKLIAENRQRYHKVKKASYLLTFSKMFRLVMTVGVKRSKGREQNQ